MPRIFVVDDDPFILQLITGYLKKEQYEVISFPHGGELIGEVRSKSRIA